MAAAVINRWTRAWTSSSGARKFRYEFLAASAVCLLLVGWLFHKPLIRGEVMSFGMEYSWPPNKTMLEPSEPHFQLLAPHFTLARMLRSGQFPAWTPLNSGGTPLLGKFMLGVFSSFTLMIYVLPLGLPPYVLICFLVFTL